ncbi:hypothetical protein ACWEQL_33475 [Kitasatospora sp. NPDC004240]
MPATSTLELDPAGPYLLRRRTARLLPEAAALVTGHMREPMPPTLVRLTHPGQWGPAVIRATGGDPTWWRAMRETQHLRRTAHESTGMTVPTHDGHALVLLHADAVRNEGQLLPTLVHELVHAVQMGRPATAAGTLARNRHHLGLDRQSHRWLADHDAAIARDETEAYRLEHLLAAN